MIFIQTNHLDRTDREENEHVHVFRFFLSPFIRVLFLCTCCSFIRNDSGISVKQMLDRRKKNTIDKKMNNNGRERKKKMRNDACHEMKKLLSKWLCTWQRKPELRKCAQRNNEWNTWFCLDDQQANYDCLLNERTSIYLRRPMQRDSCISFIARELLPLHF